MCIYIFVISLMMHSGNKQGESQGAIKYVALILHALCLEKDSPNPSAKQFFPQKDPPGEAICNARLKGSTA